MTFQEILNLLKKLILEYGPKLVAAILLWIIGIRVVKLLSNKFKSVLDKRNTDESLKPFLNNLVSSLLKIILIISILGMLGIEITSFIAILEAAGLAIGMVLSGTLQNFAGGIVLLTFKPFKVGDLIQSHLGTVKEIQIFNTILKTPDNKTVVIPNGGLSNSSMTNYSTEKKRRVDWTFGIGYGDNIDTAEKIIKRLCEDDSRILEEPESFVALTELADSSINFTVRAWVYSENYWNVFFDMNKNIYRAFEKEGLNIPFSQMDLHLHKNN